MNIADRILSLRKSKGISQEELADKMRVSRQAVSKWESQQSTPDIEKIIIMSDFFGVTTDYLLKGVESRSEEKEEKLDAKIFSAVGTMLNVIGLILAVTIWHEKQMSYSVGVGLVIMVIGCMIFTIGQIISENKTKQKAKKYFWLVNTWVLVFIPLSCCFNILDGRFGGFAGRIAPFPQLGNSIKTYGLFWLVYLVICIVGDFIILNIMKTSN